MKQIKAKIYSLNEIDSRIVDRLNEINLKAKDGSAYHDFNLNKYVTILFNRFGVKEGNNK